MKKYLPILVSAVVCIAGCTTQEALPEKYTCYASDNAGRIWMASARNNACKFAVIKCEKWHRQANIAHYTCAEQPSPFVNSD